MQYEVILGVLMAGFIGFYYLKTRAQSPKYLKQQNKDLEQLAAHNRGEAAKWRGKFNSTKAMPAIEGDFDITSEEGIKDLIKEYLPKLSGILPNELKTLASDPKAVDVIVEFYKKDPERAKKLIGKFLNRKGKIGIQTTEPQSEGL